MWLGYGVEFVQRLMLFVLPIVVISHGYGPCMHGERGCVWSSYLKLIGIPEQARCESELWLVLLGEDSILEWPTTVCMYIYGGWELDTIDVSLYGHVNTVGVLASIQESSAVSHFTFLFS